MLLVLSCEKIYVSKEKGRGQNYVEELKTNLYSKIILIHFRSMTILALC